MTIQPLYIVGEFKDGQFTQVRPWGGYTGTRAFKRLSFAQDFLENSRSSTGKIYEITEVKELA